MFPITKLANENSASDISENCNENGYVTPRPHSSVIQCGCQTLSSSQYQNLTDHTCPSTTSSIAWNKSYFIFLLQKCFNKSPKVCVRKKQDTFKNWPLLNNPHFNTKNLTDHMCPSTTSSIAWNTSHFIFFYNSVSIGYCFLSPN